MHLLLGYWTFHGRTKKRRCCPPQDGTAWLGSAARSQVYFGGQSLGLVSCCRWHFPLGHCVVYSSLWYINMNLLPLLPNDTTLFHTHYDLHEGPLHLPANNVGRALPTPWRYSTCIWNICGSMAGDGDITEPPTTGPFHPRGTFLGDKLS